MDVIRELIAVEDAQVERRGEATAVAPRAENLRTALILLFAYFSHLTGPQLATRFSGQMSIDLGEAAVLASQSAEAGC